MGPMPFHPKLRFKIRGFYAIIINIINNIRIGVS